MPSLASQLQSITPRDFIATRRQLLCAIVAPGSEENRLLATVRYAHIHGQWRKLNTQEANAYLALHLPNYIYYSKRCSAFVHGIPVEDITTIYKPRERLAEIMESATTCGLENKARRIATALADKGIPLAVMGLTGSLLVHRHGPDSDIDFVLYDRQAFQLARAAVQQLVTLEDLFQTIPLTEWQRIYARRGCALNFEEFVWHEQRKYNKAMIAGTKFDMTLLTPAIEPVPAHTVKLGEMMLTARVLDASKAYDYPATYRIESSVCAEVCSYTQTYCGQAIADETIVAHGTLERQGHPDSTVRLVVGSSREAEHQFIKVVH